MENNINISSLIKSTSAKLKMVEEELSVFRENNETLILRAEERKEYLYEIMLTNIDEAASLANSNAESIKNRLITIDNISLINYLCFPGELSKASQEVFIGLEVFIEKPLKDISMTDIVSDINQALYLIKTMDRLLEIIHEAPIDFINYMELTLTHE